MQMTTADINHDLQSIVSKKEQPIESWHEVK